MKATVKKNGFTMIEITVVIFIIAFLASLSLPALKALFNSIQGGSATRALISTTLSSARAIAAKEQTYAGVRFQHANNPANPLDSCQYMIFIIYEEPANMGNIANGFKAVEGLEPVKLPDMVAVMDLRDSAGNRIDTDGEIDNNNELIDTTTFSILFSPTGKLLIHDVRTRNRDGRTANTSEDDIFNTETNVNDGIAMFVQDDYPASGLDEESSRNCFIIYDKNELKKVSSNDRWTDYLQHQAGSMIYINPYTGRLIVD